MHRLTVLTHGHCFDGLASAAIFTALRRALGSVDDLSFSYRALGYGPKFTSVPIGMLAGDENALLDFKYVESDKLHWFFDHHPTGFASEKERARANDKVRASRGKRRLYYDASSPSAARIIMKAATELVGSEIEPMAELARWADKVDSASFDDPAEAYFARSPVLALADVVERYGDQHLLADLIPELLSGDVERVGRLSRVESRAAPIREEKAAHLELVKQSGEMIEDVVLTDFSEVNRPKGTTGGAGKFATYVAFPKATYSVGVLPMEGHVKIGVGHNPWSGAERRHDLGAICKREGGGGHPYVGAFTFPKDQAEDARRAARRIARELAGLPPLDS